LFHWMVPAIDQISILNHQITLMCLSIFVIQEESMSFERERLILVNLKRVIDCLTSPIIRGTKYIEINWVQWPWYGLIFEMNSLSHPKYSNFPGKWNCLKQIISFNSWFKRVLITRDYTFALCSPFVKNIKPILRWDIASQFSYFSKEFFNTLTQEILQFVL
jgi:hypothetical protein